MIRLNRYLAQAGVCSRRDADALIASGAVRVDGKRVQLGETVDPSRVAITVHGKAVAAARTSGPATIVLNKPRGVITTMRDERGRRSVADLLPPAPRYAPVGRLDAESTGVLLFTTDGDLARILTHPSYGVEKRYRVTTAGELKKDDIDALGALNVVRSADGSTRFDVILREGRNRQVRRMCAQRGLRVIALERVQFGPVSLRGLRPGDTRPLTTLEEEALKRLRAKRATVRPTE